MIASHTLQTGRLVRRNMCAYIREKPYFLAQAETGKTEKNKMMCAALSSLFFSFLTHYLRTILKPPAYAAKPLTVASIKWSDRAEKSPRSSALGGRHNNFHLFFLNSFYCNLS